MIAVIVKKVMDTDTPFYRPPFLEQESANIHPDILTLMKECWAEEPLERPLFVEVTKTLKAINKGRSVCATFPATL